MLSKDIINIIIQYSYSNSNSNCNDCKKIHNHTKFFSEISFTGEILSKYSRWDFYNLSRYKFDNRDIGNYIQNYDMYCQDCFDKYTLLCFVLSKF
mgnify:CR=1 FL=1